MKLHLIRHWIWCWIHCIFVSKHLLQIKVTWLRLYFNVIYHKVQDWMGKMSMMKHDRDQPWWYHWYFYSILSLLCCYNFDVLIILISVNYIHSMCFNWWLTKVKKRWKGQYEDEGLKTKKKPLRVIENKILTSSTQNFNA